MPLRSITRRTALGAALAAAALTLLFARPDIAFAHHIEVEDDASCAGWTAKAEYIGGSGDRKIVVDVWINDEHITETFLFDNAHLGHQSYWLLYQRQGTGSLETSGTIKMYEKQNGAYTTHVETDYTEIDLVCATPTAPATNTATATPDATSTPVPTSTPDDTPEPEGSITPLPTHTPTNTPPSGTPVASTSTPQPPSSATPSSPAGRPQATPTLTLVLSTPTFTDDVRGSTPTPPSGDTPPGGETPETGAGLPDAGDGRDSISFVVTMLAFALIIVGIATIVGGRALRAKK